MPKLDFICVYRKCNEASVVKILAELTKNSREALWELDVPVTALADQTIGTGPGLRPELLNRLAATLPSDDRWLIVADDDVKLPSGQFSL